MKLANRPLNLRTITRGVLRMAIATVVVGLFFVATQDLHIFPGLYDSYIRNHKQTPPSYITELSTQSSDGTPVTIWHLPVPQEKHRGTALLFHGNAETISSFVQMQRWLRAMGVSSYSMEYRGFNGRDSGWPSEAGIYADIDATLELIKQREGADATRLLILGNSIGTGSAAYAAQKAGAGALVMIAPYSSLIQVVREQPLVGALAPFVNYQFPTEEYLPRLPQSSCVILVHGRKDGVIPFSHSERLREVLGSRAGVTLVESATAGHNDVLALLQKEVAAEIKRCLPLSSNATDTRS